MSSKNNVNKDFYTLAGRDRPNELIIDAAARRMADEIPERRGGAQPNFIPGAAPVGESPVADDAVAPEAQSSLGKTGTRSDSAKQAAARRGGKAPGKARPKAGAFGDARRQSQTTASAKRGTTRAEPAPSRDGRRAQNTASPRRVS
jgi:hypothetical protein